MVTNDYSIFALFIHIVHKTNFTWLNERKLSRVSSCTGQKDHSNFWKVACEEDEELAVCMHTTWRLVTSLGWPHSERRYLQGQELGLDC